MDSCLQVAINFAGLIAHSRIAIGNSRIKKLEGSEKPKDIRELNIFTYVRQKGGSVYISEVADHDDWKVVRSDLIKHTGINTIPQIYVDRIEKQGGLVLKHEHDGRDLDLDYAHNVCDHLLDLWGDEFKFFTVIEEEPFEI